MDEELESMELQCSLSECTGTTMSRGFATQLHAFRRGAGTTG